MIRNVRPLTFRPTGCSDAVEGTNAPKGAMALLKNLIPSATTAGMFTCRPAAKKLIDFAALGYASPGFVSSFEIIGDLCYGTIQTSRNVGKDEPFCVNLATNTVVPVSGITAANVPTSPLSTGAWTPPIVAQIAGRVIVTHPGFPGGAIKFGWFDVSSFTTTLTATEHNNTTLDGFTGNQTLGIQPGMTVTGAHIPAGTTVVSITSTSVTISQAATQNGTENVTFAGGTLAAPLWGAGDTNINNLPSVPVGVCLSVGAGAAYALGANGVAVSDPGIPCQISNNPNSQFFVTTDGLSITAVAPLMLSAPLVTTGIVQAVLLFKGVRGIVQLTGDPSLSNVALVPLPMATGTAAPLSIAPCSLGTAFISPEGLRIAQFNGTLSDPVGDAGMGVAVPFIYAVTPSRVCGAANADTLRFAVQNGFVSNQQQEWWFDLTRKIWTGPHTFVPSLIKPWRGVNNQNTFVMAPQGILASLWETDVLTSATASFIENGATLTWTYQSVPLPDNGAGAMNALTELSVTAGFDSQLSTLTAGDFAGTPGLSGGLPVSALPAPAIWGQNKWGDGSVWGGGATTVQQWPVYLTDTPVFKQLSLTIAGQSSAPVQLGNVQMRIKTLKYMLPIPAGITNIQVSRTASGQLVSSMIAMGIM